ncbi:tetratricopeptide repeat protein [Aeromonas sp. R5-4]|uniref:tetratricopeptide repeat protein n=1 Tax=Aeromonas sp. R5-4 TaxID=3138470 RepID=UPI0034A24E17
MQSMLSRHEFRHTRSGTMGALWLALGMTLSGAALAVASPAPPVTSSANGAPTASVAVTAPSDAQIQQWAYSAQDISLPAVERADALRQLAAYPNQNSLVAVARSLRDEHALVREAAVIAADPYQFAHRWRLLSPLLDDSSAEVRRAATLNLARDYGAMNEGQLSAIGQPLAELSEYLARQQDPAQQLLQADLYRWTRQWDKAQASYEQLLANQPDNPLIWLGLSDNLRAQQRDAEALALLNKGILALPQNANFHYAKALTQVRLDQKSEAAVTMAQAAELAGNNSYFWYLNGVLQEPLDLEKAIGSFELAYRISGAPEQLYAVCDIYLRHDHPKSDTCMSELGKIAPPEVLAELNSKRASKTSTPPVSAGQ